MFQEKLIRQPIIFKNFNFERELEYFKRDYYISSFLSTYNFTVRQGRSITYSSLFILASNKTD